MSISSAIYTYNIPKSHAIFRINSSNSSSNNTNPKRGFGRQSIKKDSKSDAPKSVQQKDLLPPQQRPAESPGLNSRGRAAKNVVMDADFEERLAAVKRSALEQKKTEEKQLYGAIDYDAPVQKSDNTIGIGTKIGVGVAVIVFGLVFALGDFLPGSVSPTEEAPVASKQLSEEEKSTLQARLQQYDATLSISPNDPTALEGAAVTLTELGDYTRAASLLEELIKAKPRDPEALRLLGEVKYELKDFDGSISAYRRSAEVSNSFEVLRGYTNALLAAKKPDEAVKVLLSYRERLNAEKSSDSKSESGTTETEVQKVDPVQIDLLLGKSYSDWGHISDAISVYDRLISGYPEDFRGYLAKGIILKQNGNPGGAERMFIQARFFSPKGAKALVDRYSRK